MDNPTAGQPERPLIFLTKEVSREQVRELYPSPVAEQPSLTFSELLAEPYVYVEDLKPILARLEAVAADWQSEKDTQAPTDRSKWYEMALVRCARELLAILGTKTP